MINFFKPIKLIGLVLTNPSYMNTEFIFGSLNGEGRPTVVVIVSWLTDKILIQCMQVTWTINKEGGLVDVYKSTESGFE